MNWRWLKWLGLGLGGALALGALWPKRLRFSAWTGQAAIDQPAHALELAKRYQLDGLDLVLNDATQGEPFRFSRPPAAIAAAVELWQAAGLSVAFTTWGVPEASWLAGMPQVGALAKQCGVKLVTLDLEERWMAGLRPLSALERFDWTARTFEGLRAGGYRGEVGVTCIVYADLAVLSPALEACDVIIPQAYATVKNVPSSAPGTLERTALERYRRFGKRLILGAAAWNLEGAYQLPALQALVASLDAAKALGVPEVRFWRLEFLDDAGVGETLVAWRSGDFSQAGRAVA